MQKTNTPGTRNPSQMDIGQGISLAGIWMSFRIFFLSAGGNDETTSGMRRLIFVSKELVHPEVRNAGAQTLGVQSLVMRC